MSPANRPSSEKAGFGNHVALRAATQDGTCGTNSAGESAGPKAEYSRSGATMAENTRFGESPAAGARGPGRPDRGGRAARAAPVGAAVAATRGLDAGRA